jgi:hypothetical protein
MLTISKLLSASVAVSRGAEDAQLFTNDREKLPQTLGHDVSHESAHVPAMKPEQAVTPPQPGDRAGHRTRHGLRTPVSNQ